MVRKIRRSHVDQLSLRLLVAVSGVTASVAACAGRSDSSDDNGGTSGSSASGGTGQGGGSSASGGSTASGGSSARGGKGGTGQGGSSTTGGSGGTAAESGTGGSSRAGNSGSAGSGNQSSAGFGGMGALGGTTNGGAGNVKPHGCVELDAHPTSAAACEGGFAHRAPNTVCSLSPHPEPGAAGAAGEGGAGSAEPPPGPPETRTCTTDADCTAAAHGYCIRDDNGQTITIGCMYGCKDDSDCASGELCSCEDGYLSDVSRQPLAFGVCKPTSCRDDEACGPGLLCISPMQAACGTPRPGAYQCQTADDECGGPADCPPAKSLCMYRAEHFVCEAAPICGRPFLVEGALRQSDAVACPAWLDTAMTAEPLPPLTPSLRAAVAEHWVAAGLMEHASIAAFARFTLQLMALGAPADLVEGATQAMADETRHAKTCFGLATRYAEREVGPGPLDVTGALGAVELLDVVDLVIEEGCIGETGAALEAQWAADAAKDPSVARALRQIADDEARHAELAWRFVAWAATRDARVGGRVQSHLTAALARLTDSPAPARDATSRQLMAHGVLDERTRRDARLASLSEVLPGVVARLVA